MLELLSRPWPWWVAGPLLGLTVPFVYWYGGRKWGVSSSLRHICAATVPAGLDYFRYSWRTVGGWQLAMVAGMVGGGLAAVLLLPAPSPSIALAPATLADLAALGITDTTGLVPPELISWRGLLTPAGATLVVGGGFLVGFGARWAGGCTSGHAVSGLAHLRPASLVAVLGFFAGGLVAVHALLPLLLGPGAP